MERIQAHHYIMDENNSQKRKNEVYFTTDTDHVFDINNKQLTAILKKMDQDIIDAGNKAKSMVITLKGDLKGKAGVADDYSVTMDTELTHTYLQKAVLTGVVEGEAVPATKEQGIATISTTFKDVPTYDLELTGNVTGKATVNKTTGKLTLSTTSHKTAQLPLPINSVQFSLDSQATGTLKTVYGGTWTYIGDVQVLNSSSNTTFSLYMYKKTSLT